MVNPSDGIEFMKIEIRSAGSVRVLDLHGRLVLGQPEDTLKEAVQRLLAEGHGRILINLHGVPYVDSAGIGQLAACKKRVLEKKGAITILWTEGKYHLAVDTIIMLMFPAALFEDEARAIASFE
jgi:anti-sigma B factor antagonist